MEDFSGLILSNIIKSSLGDSWSTPLPRTVKAFIHDLLDIQLIDCKGWHANQSNTARSCTNRHRNTGCGHGDRVYALLLLGSEMIGDPASSIAYRPSDFSDWSILTRLNLELDRAMHDIHDRDENRIREMQHLQHALVMEEVRYLVLQLMQIEKPI